MKIYNPFKGLLNIIRKLFNNHRKKVYLRRLKYALARTLEPYHSETNDEEREFKADAIKWLIMYYEGQSDFVADGPPETKLKKLLSMPAREVSRRDYVYTKVFYYWKEHRRVGGF